MLASEESMPLTVTAIHIGAKLHQLLIFDGKTLIGGYERAQEADIERKKREVSNV